MFSQTKTKMKKLFLIPLMACMVCLSVGAGNVTTSDELIAAFAGDGTTITLTEDITLASGITIGTKNGSESKKTFTLDLNGHNLITGKDAIERTGKPKKFNACRTFTLYRGNLYIKNSVPGIGGIYNMHDSIKAGVPQYNSNSIIFDIYGSNTPSCNSETAAVSDLQSYLCVEEGVNLYSAVNAIVITETTGSYSEKKVSFNVRVDLKGAINPGVDQGKYGIKPNGTIGYIEEAKLSSPFIHVFPSATINVSHDLNKAVAAYSSGYARWMIEGTLTGATALYIKSGEIVMNNAVAESTWTDEATLTLGGAASGVDGGGNAVVIESHKSYPGAVNLTVTGDSKISTEAENGAALTETVSASTSKVETINIEGGNFSSGEGGNAILISNQTASSDDVPIVVNGVTLVGEIGVGETSGAAAIEELMPAGTHTTVIENEDGTKTTIISEGAAPDSYDTWAAVEALEPRTSVNWTGTEEIVIGDGTAEAIINLGEFTMKAGTSLSPQRLTIKNNAELHVDKLNLNDQARIVVEAGGKLVVEGEQGIYAPSEDNILIKTSSAKPAYFMFNPAVTSNKTPKAKVQLYSKGRQVNAEGLYIYQRFGFPGGNTNVTRADVLYDHVAYPTAMWQINTTEGASMNYFQDFADDDLFVPFASYVLTTNKPDAGAIYTFPVEVVGNTNAEFNLYSKFNYFANSYTAPISIDSLIKDLTTNFPHIEGTINLHDPESNKWYFINTLSAIFHPEYPNIIEPMQALILVRQGGGANPIVNYKKEVWDPMMNAPASPAPARASEISCGTARIEIIAADGSSDEVCLVEGDQFSSDYDNAADATKIMIDKPSFIYADGAEDKMSMLATDNLLGTTLSMTTTEHTSFIMNFSCVNGMNYAIQDMQTGTVVDIANGGSYMFTVPADATVTGRFKIVNRREVPTTIEDVQVENAVNGIYTMTGQFVGTDFFSLPSGVYVVNGKKVVK